MPRNDCEWMIKEGRRKKVCWSIDKEQKKAQGWVIEGEPVPKKEHTPEPIKLPEIAVEVGVDAYDDESIAYNVQGEREPLDEMTKAELLEWAMDQGHDLPNNDRKSDILEACKQIEAEG